MQNIENTIFTNALPVNGYPMMERFKELMEENFKARKDWKQDKRIERLLWLIMATFTGNQIGSIDMCEWWAQLNAQKEA